MHLHILGLSGTFMSGLALLAKAAGHKVTGSDTNCYPPVSDLLRDNDILWTDGYEDCSLALQADCVVVGNAIKRGMPVMEAVLNANIPYISGPQWLYEHILRRYRVIAVSGTHGKTTTTSMLAFILEYAGLKPAFLIGGVSSDFKTSARLGEGDWFVIEADEYDSAFFDKRPKFMHYRPEVAILNNLEFDHADIYSDLPAIQQQFHYFLKTIPSTGLVIKPREDQSLNEVLARGQFSGLEELSLQEGAHWQAELLHENGSAFRIKYKENIVAEVNWRLIGQFNVENALAAVAASHRAGVSPQIAARALEQFTPVKRRLEVKSSAHGIMVYDDFAHHPTAIGKTVRALSESNRHQRIFVVLEFASYTMKTGVHASELAQALEKADKIFLLNPPDFSIHEVSKDWSFPHQILPNTTSIIQAVMDDVRPGDGVLVMSNRGFDNIHTQLSQNIHERFHVEGKDEIS